MEAFGLLMHGFTVLMARLAGSRPGLGVMSTFPPRIWVDTFVSVE